MDPELIAYLKKSIESHWSKELDPWDSTFVTTDSRAKMAELAAEAALAALIVLRLRMVEQ